MPSLRYKNHYLSVLHLPDKSGNSAFITCVEIRHELESVAIVRLMLDAAISGTADAHTLGLAQAKQWIDRQSAHNQLAVTQRAEASTGMLLRLKAWFASLIGLLATR